MHTYKQNAKHSWASATSGQGRLRLRVARGRMRTDRGRLMTLKCTQLPPDYIPDCPLARYSEDNILNGYGRELLNLCQGSKLGECKAFVG